jgi:predicted DNA-binding transcriptional regulator AlpA
MHPQEYTEARKAPQSADDDALLTAAQTRARFGGVSAMCLWRWRNNPALAFPRPVRIGSSSRLYWRLGDLRAWQAEQAKAAA